MFKNKYKKGFSLAEILIVLGIIGVVAVVTIPTLIENYQKQSTVPRLKAAYSTFAQAIKLSESENGDISGWNFDLNTKDFVNRYLAPYMKLTMVGYYDLPTNKGVDYHFDYLGATTRDATNQWVVLHSTAPAYVYSLPKGFWATIVVFKSHTFAIGTCIIRVDINGKSHPNMLGKDVFTFSFSTEYTNLTPGISNQFKHYKSDRNTLLKETTVGGCNPKAAANWGNAVGDACSVVIMKDGWKISKDYPW